MLRTFFKGIIFCLISTFLFPALVSAKGAGEGIFVGAIKQELLLDKYQSFAQEYHHYDATVEQVAGLQAVNKDIELVVLFGTWCHDSVREVPRLLKLVNSANNPNLSVKLVAVSLDKQQPQYIEPLSLKYTPTIVVVHEGNEIGRIVESPTTTLSDDLMRIINPELPGHTTDISQVAEPSTRQ